MSMKDYLITAPQFILPKRLVTVLAGCLAEVKNPAVKNRLIKAFIWKFGVNMQEALRPNAEDYACFNDFFIRHLKPGCRPLAASPLISPVDGCVSEIGSICEGQLLQAKGRYYALQELLGCDAESARPYQNGHFATLYLSPKDYHRVHMPLAGELVSTVYHPGQLFSVQPATAQVIPHLFARNERLVMNFKTELGPMALVMVGATIVGAIGTSWKGDIQRSSEKKVVDYTQQSIFLGQGQEAGYFKLGSTVILLFPNQQPITWLPTLKPGTPVKMGETLVAQPLS